MTVTTGTLPCTAVAITDAVNLTRFSCLAPPGPGFGAVLLNVTVTGLPSALVPLPYAAPEVHSVSGSPCDAELLCTVIINGANLGLRNSLTGPEPMVRIGGVPCDQPLVLDSGRLQCITPAGVVVGPFHVVVSLNGQNSSESVVLDRLCGDGRYAPKGALCGPCPPNAQCIGLFPMPLPLPGFYPLSLTEFAACVPVKACVGVDADAVGALFRALLADSAQNATAQAMITTLLRVFSGVGSDEAPVCLAVACV
jgi:hypothetical protein